VFVALEQGRLKSKGMRRAAAGEGTSGGRRHLEVAKETSELAQVLPAFQRAVPFPSYYQ